MATIELGSFNIYLGIVLNALATGIGMGCGIAIGSWISNKHLLKLPKKIRRMLKIKNHKKKTHKKKGGKTKK